MSETELLDKILSANSTMRVKDKVRVETLLEALNLGGLEKLQVVADFDYTLTKTRYETLWISERIVTTWIRNGTLRLQMLYKEFFVKMITLKLLVDMHALQGQEGQLCDRVVAILKLSFSRRILCRTFIVTKRR
jgi:hypothetical protein